LVLYGRLLEILLVSFIWTRTRVFHPSKILKIFKSVPNTRAWTRALQCSEDSIHLSDNTNTILTWWRTKQWPCFWHRKRRSKQGSKKKKSEQRDRLESCVHVEWSWSRFIWCYDMIYSQGGYLSFDLYCWSDKMEGPIYRERMFAMTSLFKTMWH